MPIKRCIKCGEEKESKEFPKRKLSKDGFRNDCKKCYNKQKKEWAENNPEKYKEYGIKWRKNNYGIKWRKNNPEKVRKSKEKWAKNNQDKIKKLHKKWRKNNSGKYKEYGIEWRKNNFEKYKEWRRKYMFKRIKTNIHFRLKSNISCLIRARLKKRLLSKNRKSTFSFLPYTIDDLIKHLESLFQPWMNWQNYGNKSGCWCIDHRYPDSLFNYTSVKDEEFQKCWALENLQPMEFIKNIKKGNRI